MLDIQKEQDKAEVLIEALPYFQQFYGATVLVKFGGSAMEDLDRAHDVLRDVAFMKVAGMNPIVVHGGGKAINAELKKENIQAKFINGLRYTDAATIKVVDRVLHNVVNAHLAEYLREQCHASSTPVSGKNILRCQKIGTTDAVTHEPLDLGFVGKVVNVDTPQLEWIISRGEIPVIAPLACDLNGGIYNINADMAACEIASEMKVRKLVFLSDVPGVLRDPNDPNSLIATIHCDEIDQMIADGVISGGMIPKLNSAREAIQAGVGQVHMIDGRVKHSILLEVFTHEGIGTQIVP
ncbi:MAG: acetylglutamate kinase [Victivallales bacterium]|nr:acetylglutamate kinase [Victivallales bacterium]